MKLEEFLKLIHYKIGDGSKFLWKCFGENARFLDYDGDCDEFNITCIYDSKTLDVYMLELNDCVENKGYRWIDPDYIIQYKDECITNNIDEYTDLFNITSIEVLDDIKSKISCVVEGIRYDPNVLVPVDLPDDQFIILAKLAHERNITLNQLFEDVIRDSINKYEKIID